MILAIFYKMFLSSDAHNSQSSVTKCGDSINYEVYDLSRGIPGGVTTIQDYVKVRLHVKPDTSLCALLKETTCTCLV